MYILDGLLKNTSDIQPDTLHADTQGQSTPVFALSYLLGIKLMPRIRNWQDLTFFRPTQDAKYKYIDPLFKGVVDWNAFDISKAVQILSGEGYPIRQQELASLSPYVTRHIKRYGDYVVDLQNIPQPLESAILLPIEIIES